MRYVVAFSSVALAFAALASCNGSTPSCDDGEVVGPDGGCIASPGPYCQPCTGKVAAALPTGDCPSQDCPPPHAYAVCTESCWSACACTVPPGYELVDAGFFAAEGGDVFDALTRDASSSAP